MFIHILYSSKYEVPPHKIIICFFNSVFRHLIQVEPDSVWFTLAELHCPSPYIPPHPDLHPVKLSGMGRVRDEYSDNVLKLLREEFDSEMVSESVG